jgi:rhodanese-related sulfurtransferase
LFYGLSTKVESYSVRLVEARKEGNLAELRRITVDEVKKRMDKGEAILLIDTRNPHDWGESGVKLPGALRLHYSELEKHLEELPRDRTIVTYCT